MHTSVFFAAAALIPSILAQATFSKSSKRGLVFIPPKNTADASDDQIWNRPGSDLTWYYNYGVQPSSAYSNTTQADWEFVPMLWGTSDTSFLSEVQTLVKNGRNITHVLTFNEPDGTTATGGSNIQPSTAATAWISEVEPLRKMGIKTGAPAVTGSQGGFTWLQEFFDSCHSQGTNCTADFFPVHWYGDFQGLASQLGQVVGTYPNKSIWITEYAFNDQPLAATQSFFNSSAEYFDRLDYVERYSYFGSFRSDVSNVGPNAAMLTKKGQLTDIGSWYLGGAATNNNPSGSAATRPTIGVPWVLTASITVAFLLL